MTSIAIKSVAASALLICAAASFSSAQAHIVLEYQVAMAGSYYKATFKVGHACGNSPIRQIVVNVPAGVQGAKPMPKPGWALEIARESNEVRRITWTARTREDALPNDYYDEFVLQARLPQQPGPMYWPVSQVCEQGRIDWAELPAPGQPLSALKAPAAYLEILPADGAGGGGHNH
jgi:uncharacterized protein YcnI